MEPKLLLKLDYGVRRWFPNVAQGVDYFIEYLRFTVTSLVEFEEAPEYVEYFIWRVQPTPPYYRYVKLVYVIEILFSLYYLDLSEYVLGPPYASMDMH